MPDTPLRQFTPAGVLKGTQARPAGSVVIEPRPPLTLGVPPEDGHDPADLRELHDSLRLDPEAVAAERAADRILAEAQAKRDSLLSSAAREAEQAKAQMEQELATMQQAAELELTQQRAELVDGLRRELEQQFTERYGAALAQLEQAAAELSSRRNAYLAEIEGPAFELVLAISRQLLAGELSRAPAFVARLIAEAFTQLQPQPVAQVGLHPATLELLLRDELLGHVLAQRGISLEQLELKANPALRHDQFEVLAGMALISFDLQEKAAELIDALEQRAAGGAGVESGA